MGRVENKVAIITGGAGGIGAATAKLLASEGAKVTITDLNAKVGESLAAEIGGDFIAQDVTDERLWKDIVAGVEAKHGAVHILVNAAGIEGDMMNGAPESVSYEDWKRVHAINLDGTFLGCRTAMPVMRRAGGGSIINISSIVALMASPNSAAYGSSKAGVRHLTMSVAHQGAQNGDKIRCNSVHPGLIKTRMLNDIHAEIARKKNISFEEARGLSLARVPMGELGEPEDVAYLILYLASDESRYVTGAPFSIDGGWNLN
ncbi:MAG: SDR family oxidoreductase [Rhodospirillales bacterium]|nr:SDR family oxidoreductase [Rhodospirillales bacterium]